jgi:hypothetical protein
LRRYQNITFSATLWYKPKIFAILFFVGLTSIALIAGGDQAIAKVQCASLDLKMIVDSNMPRVLAKKLSDQITVTLFTAAEIQHGDDCRLTVAMEVIRVGHLDAPVQVLIHRPLPTEGAGGVRINMILSTHNTEVWRTIREARGLYGAIALNGIAGRALAPIFDAADFIAAINPFTADDYDLVRSRICALAQPRQNIPSSISGPIKIVRYINWDDELPCMIYCDSILYKTGVKQIIIDPNTGEYDDMRLAFGVDGQKFYSLYLAPYLKLVRAPPDETFVMSDIVPSSPYPAHQWTLNPNLQADAELGYDETVIAVGPLSSGGVAFITTTLFKDLHSATPPELSRDILIGPGAGRAVPCNGSTSSAMSRIIMRIRQYNKSLGVIQ